MALRNETPFVSDNTLFAGVPEAENHASFRSVIHSFRSPN